MSGEGQRWQLIRLHAAVPPKPTLGAPCNGCGVCCAAEPCPLSRLLLGHRRDVCPALDWREDERRYVCGLATRPAAHLRWLPRAAGPLFAPLVRRWIAAGKGCDFDAEVSAEVQ